MKVIKIYSLKNKNAKYNDTLAYREIRKQGQSTPTASSYYIYISNTHTF